MTDIGSRATFEQNAAPEIALGRAAANMMSPSAEQRAQQEAAAAQGLRGPAAGLEDGATAIVAALDRNHEAQMQIQTTIVTKITDLGTNVTTLGTQVLTHADQIGELAVRADTQQNTIGELADKADTQHNTIVQLAGRADAQQNVIHALNQNYQFYKETELKFKEAVNDDIIALHEANDICDKKIKELEAVVENLQQTGGPQQAPPATDNRGAGGVMRHRAGCGVRRVLVMGEYVYGLNIEGGWKKPPQSGHYGITGHSGNFRVRLFTRVQENEKNRYNRKPVKWTAKHITSLYRTLHAALEARDFELTCLNLRVVTCEEDGSYRVVPLSGAEDAPGAA